MVERRLGVDRQTICDNRRGAEPGKAGVVGGAASRVVRSGTADGSSDGLMGAGTDDRKRSGRSAWSGDDVSRSEMDRQRRREGYWAACVEGVRNGAAGKYGQAEVRTGVSGPADEEGMESSWTVSDDELGDVVAVKAGSGKRCGGTTRSAMAVRKGLVTRRHGEAWMAQAGIGRVGTVVRAGDVAAWSGRAGTQWMDRKGARRNGSPRNGLAGLQCRVEARTPGVGQAREGPADGLRQGTYGWEASRSETV